MKKTGRINQFTGEEILRVEELDIMFWDKNWDELSDNEKVMFLSFMNIQFLGKMNESFVRNWYKYYQEKNFMCL